MKRGRGIKKNKDYNKKIVKGLYNEITNSINNNIGSNGIINLESQFALLTILGYTPEEKNEIYQIEISNFFSLLTKFGKELDIDNDLFGDQFTNKTANNVINILRSIGITNFNVYLMKNKQDIKINTIDINNKRTSKEICGIKKNIGLFSENVKKLIKSKKIKKSKNFNYLYSDNPVGGVGEDLAILLDMKDKGIKLIFGFDNIHKAMTIKSVPIIENMISIIENKLLLDFSRRDDLTGLLRRDFFLSALKKEKKGSFIMFDIDNFKSINDTFGHNVGDIVIKKVTNIINSNSKSEKDITCRWGGEEFVLFLKDITNPLVINKIFNRIKQNLAKVDIDKLDGRKITLSAGGYICNKLSPKKIIKNIGKADEKLYESKNTGKDKITI